jgi:cob(I)alamin adenosyltransferase
VKIYTKTGDQGETGFFGGGRVKKDDARIAAYGDVDELNAFVGLVRSANPDTAVDAILKSIQNDLFDLGAVLATPESKNLEGKGSFVGEREIANLEREIDRMEKDLTPLKTFILPGGSETAAHLHIARTVCRRAERSVVTLAGREKIGAEIVTYLNRLSDFLFVLARWVNFKQGVADVEWSKKEL